MYQQPDFAKIQVGDIIVRNMVGCIMELYVTEIDDKFIYAGGGWKFDKQTGNEIDEDLKWDNNHSGSFIEGFRKDV
jgi:hypothetical protein